MTRAAELSGPNAKAPVIRDCTVADASAIARIYNEHVLAGTSTMDTEPKTVEDMTALIQGFNDRETILLIDDDGDILGWLPRLLRDLCFPAERSDPQGLRHANETGADRPMQGMGLSSPCG